MNFRHLFRCDTVRYTLVWNECIIISCALCYGDSFYIKASLPPILWREELMIFKSPGGTLKAMMVTQKPRNFLGGKFPMLFCFFERIFTIIFWKPNILGPREFRLCEPFGSYKVKIKESELKIGSHRPIVHWILIKYWQRTMVIWCFLTKLLQLQVLEKCWHKET